MIREIFFKGFLKEDESIHVVIHRHIFFLKRILVRDLFFGIFLPLGVWFLFPQTLLFVVIWAWFGLIRFLYDFIGWYYDAWLVTNISILQIQWDGFFKKSATRTEYHHIESIGYEIKGFIGTLLNFGTITIEKETGGQIMFLNAAFPKKKVEQMMQYQDLFVTQKNIRDHRTLKGLLTDLLSHHFSEYGLPESDLKHKKNK